MLCYFTKRRMARIENWDKIRRNIIVVKFEKKDFDQILEHEIREAERKLMLLRLKRNAVVQFFAPDRHSLFEKGLLKEGRVITLADCKVNGSVISEWNEIHLVKHIDEINSLENIISAETLDKLRYDGEKYRRVTLVFSDSKEILRLSGVREENI